MLCLFLSYCLIHPSGQNGDSLVFVNWEQCIRRQSEKCLNDWMSTTTTHFFSPVKSQNTLQHFGWNCAEITFLSNTKYLQIYYLLFIIYSLFILQKICEERVTRNLSTLSTDSRNSTETKNLNPDNMKCRTCSKNQRALMERGLPSPRDQFVEIRK